MKLTDIKKTLTNKLKANYPSYEIYGEEIEQGFVKPCFFVQILPVTNTNQGKYVDRKILIVKIHYFPMNETNEECYNMSDELYILFRRNLSVLDRHLNIMRTSSKVTDNVLFFSFDLDFLDGYIDPNDPELLYTLMQELNIE